MLRLSLFRTFDNVKSMFHVKLCFTLILKIVIIGIIMIILIMMIMMIIIIIITLKEMKRKITVSINFTWFALVGDFFFFKHGTNINIIVFVAA